MTTMDIILQVVVGVIISYIVYVIAMFVMRNDILNMQSKYDANRKGAVDIVTGYADSSTIVNTSFNTTNTNMSNYLPLTPSVNIKGGAQFSYSTWLFVGDTGSAQNQTIFLRGDNSRYTYNITDNTNKFTKTVSDRVVFCPMLAFGSKPMEFILTFNTLDNIKETMTITTKKSENTVYRKNFLSLFGDKWFAVTIVFEDNMPINDFENGLIVKFYVNDTLYQTGKYSSTLKQNTGDMCLLPDGTAIPKFKMGNFKYYNYALSDDEVKKFVAQGPPKQAALSTTKASTMPYYVSDYNKLDMYNT